MNPTSRDMNLPSNSALNVDPAYQGPRSLHGLVNMPTRVTMI